MHTLIIAIDCWRDMPDHQIQAILREPCDHRCHQHHESPPHTLMQAWPTLSLAEIVQDHVRPHRHRSRVIFVGQSWEICVWIRPTGLGAMQLFLPWTDICVRPSLLRVDRGSRELTAQDLAPADWEPLGGGLYRMRHRLTTLG